MDEDRKSARLKIINDQLYNAILNIVAIVILIVIILDQKEKANGNEGFLNNKEIENLAMLSKIILLIVVIYSIYINSEVKDLIETTGGDTSIVNLQIIGNIVSIIPALIGIYIVYKDFQSSSFQPAKLTNLDI